MVRLSRNFTYKLITVCPLCLDLHFRDSHALWTQNSSGAFTQLDLREATKPIDAIPRVATTWDATGSLGFVVDDSASNRWEVPYDDV